MCRKLAADSTIYLRSFPISWQQDVLIASQETVMDGEVFGAVMLMSVDIGAGIQLGEGDRGHVNILGCGDTAKRGWHLFCHQISDAGIEQVAMAHAGGSLRASLVGSRPSADPPLRLEDWADCGRSPPAPCRGCRAGASVAAG